MEKVTSFLKDVRIEMAKVSWPTRQQTTQYTLVVLGLSFAIAIFLGGMDYLIQWILNNFLLK